MTSPEGSSNGGGEATSQRVLPEAGRLFREKGYAASSTRELAKRLGLHKATLYHHVEKKEDLLYRICIESMNRVRAAAREALDGRSDPVERLQALISAHVTSMTGDIDMHATMLLELRSLSSDRRDEVIQLREAYASLVQGLISEAQEAGRLRDDIDPKSLSLILFNILNWTITWYRPDGGLPPERLAEISSTIFLEGARRPD